MSNRGQSARSSTPLGMVARVGLLAFVGVGATVAAADPFALLFYATHALLATILIVRRPRQIIGWLLLVIACGFIGTTSEPQVDLPALLAGTASWPDFLAAWASSWSGYALFTAYAALMLVFPSGHFGGGAGGRAGRVLVGIGIIVTALVAVAPGVGFNINGGSTTVLIPNRLAVLPELGLWSVVPIDTMIAPVVAVLVVSLTLTLRRYWRATGIEKLQLRWLVAAFGAVVLGVIAGLAMSLVLPGIGGAIWIPVIFAYPTVPLAIYFAVTRYRLYEIDRIVSRTITWAVTTGLVAALFAVLIVGLQALLAPITNQGTLVVAASTLAAAALFMPLYRRVQIVVDQHFNRTRYDGQRALEAFGTQLRDEVELDDVSTHLVGVAARTVQPRAIGLWTRQGRASG
jgi:hypothetical protein